MKNRKDQGYTMIIVMCLMFLFMALALSMLFSSSVLLARAERASAQKQSRASALSFAEWMDKELAKEAAGGGGISDHVKKRFDEKSWPAFTGDFEHEAEVAILTFTPVITGTSAVNDLGKLEVKMYWETEDGGTDPENPQVDLVVTVKAVVREEPFLVTTRYSKELEQAEGEAEPVWNGAWYVRGRE